MTLNRRRFVLDDFVASRGSLALAFAWGLSEATFFFIVPDVVLTLMACRSLRPALRASIAALVGALIGGALMYSFGNREPLAARSFLTHIPAINAELVSRVSSQLTESGLVAVLLGPLKGIPYKIYAVEWGSRSGGIFAFMLISIPARYVRFFLASVTTRLIAGLIEPVSHHRAAIEVSILAVLWVGFYVFYFVKLGW